MKIEGRCLEDVSAPVKIIPLKDTGMENQAFKSSTDCGLTENGNYHTNGHCPELIYNQDGVDLESVRVSAVSASADVGLRSSTGPSVLPRKKSKGTAPDKRKTSGEERQNAYADSSCQISSLPETGYLGDSLQLMKSQSTSTRKHSKGVQAWPAPPYRLKVIPRSEGTWRSCRQAINLIGKIAFCQIGLASLLLVWSIAGALAFRYTEGPREENAARDLAVKQKYLISTLSSELRQIAQDDKSWSETIEKYMSRHEDILASAGAQSPGHVWTFPGCMLFAVSLITTLGFGAPVPRTSEGRAVAIVFAAIGIPLHLLLVLNIGMVIAIKLQALANRCKKPDDHTKEEAKEDLSKNIENGSDFSIISTNIFKTNHRRTGSEPIGKQALSNISREASFITHFPKETKYFHITESDDRIKTSEEYNKDENSTTYTRSVKSETIIKISKDIGCEPDEIPTWLKYLPFIMITVYYVAGVLLFGVARYQSFLDSLMFPLNFTVAGGVATTHGYVRILYAIYLEGAIVLASATVSILQVSATEGLTGLGLKYGLLTNSR